MLCAALSGAPLYSADFFWLGQTDAVWSNLNWASNAAGIPTLLTPGAGDNVIFAATGAANQAATILLGNLPINSLTVNSATGIGSGGPLSTLTLTNGGAVNSALTLTNMITLRSSNALTIATAGSLNVSASPIFTRMAR